MFYAWRASGADPYCLYNSLDSGYRPFRDLGAPPRPPRFPERVRAFIYACGQYARELERTDQQQLADGIAQRLGKMLG